MGEKIAIARTRGGKAFVTRQRDVYFVQAEKLGLIKIGVADFARDRLRTLQVGSPDRLKLLGWITTDSPFLEDDIHARFHELREHGEWFRPEPALLAFIEVEVAASTERQKQVMREALASAHRAPAPIAVPPIKGEPKRKADLRAYKIRRGLLPA